MDAKKCENIGGKWNPKSETCRGFNIKRRMPFRREHPFLYENPEFMINQAIREQLRDDFDRNAASFISQRGKDTCKFMTYKDEGNKGHIAFAKDMGLDIEKSGPYRCKYNLRICELKLSGPKQVFGPVDIGHGTVVVKGWWMDDKNITTKEIEFFATDLRKPKPRMRLSKIPVDIGIKDDPTYPIFAEYNVPS